MGNPIGEFKGRYERRKAKLLADKAICRENRTLFKEFLEWLETKLKRTNGHATLDNSSYNTVYNYLNHLTNINQWFKNKPLKDLTRQDIERVYTALEDGEILSKRGGPVKDRASVYSKCFKGKLFRMVGKDSMARDVLEYSKAQKRVARYFTEEDFRDLLAQVRKPLHRALFWLAWDVGENINALLQLRKADFTKRRSDVRGEPEYLVHLKEEILKRSRTSRGVETLYPETVEVLDEVLADLKPGDRLFPFSYEYSKKLLNRALERCQVVTKPHATKPTWKDFRSSNATMLLGKGWSKEEINIRQGRTLSSDDINIYASAAGLDQRVRKGKKKFRQGQVQELQAELQEMREKQELYEKRMSTLPAQLAQLLNDRPEVLREALELHKQRGGK